MLGRCCRLKTGENGEDSWCCSERRDKKISLLKSSKESLSSSELAELIAESQNSHAR